MNTIDEAMKKRFGPASKWGSWPGSDDLRAEVRAALEHAVRRCAEVARKVGREYRPHIVEDVVRVAGEDVQLRREIIAQSYTDTVADRILRAAGLE